MYATTTDMEVRYTIGELVQVAPDSDDGSTYDAVKVGQALKDATDEIDSYVGSRYSLPLPVGTKTAILTRWCCDIARYRLYEDAATKEVKERYDRAVDWLSQLSAGKVGLDVPTDPLVPTVIPPVAIGAAYTGKVFSDEKMAEMPDFNDPYGF